MNLPNIDKRSDHWQKISKETPERVWCDNLKCDALENPVTLEDYIKAHDHWKKHGLMSGCSHGC